MSVSYQPPKKVAIVGLEIKVALEAQYNPKELQIDKSAEWKPHNTVQNNAGDLQYSSSPARTLSMELLFDTYESGEDVHEKYVSKLLRLISVMNPDGDVNTKRPSLLQVRWADPAPTRFQCVLQSVSTKYTMFTQTGTPVRATCTVKFLEALRLHEDERLGKKKSWPDPGPKGW
jgi:hypothetical protein